MIYVLILLAIIILGLGYILNEKNAKTLLSGYNTMSEEERKKVDIKSYIRLFKQFHYFLGVSFLIIGLLLHYLVGENASGVFLAVYPILAYIYLIWEGRKYYKGKSRKSQKLAIYVLAGTLVFVIALLALGFKEDPLILENQTAHFKGIYGEDLKQSEIASVELVTQLPKIRLKTNGFALGEINKGYFRTADGETVKLLLNAKNKPYIFLTKSNGKKLYFSAKEKSNKEIVEEMKKELPEVVYK